MGVLRRVAAALGVLLLSSTARAELEAEGRAALSVDAGPGTEGCIPKDELERDVNVQVGRIVFGEAPPRVQVRVGFERFEEPTRFRATIAASTDAATAPGDQTPGRELEALGDCRLLDQELVLVVGLLADAEPPVAVEIQAPPPAPPARPPPRPPDDEVSYGPVSTAPSWEARGDAPWELGVDAAAVGAVGLQPNPSLGAELAGFVEPPEWPRIRLGVTALLPDEVAISGGGTVDFLSFLVGMGVCPELAASNTVSLRACLGGDWVLTRAESHELEGSGARMSSDFRLGVVLRGSLRLGAGWLATLGVGTTVSGNADRYTIERGGQREVIFEPALVPLLASIGVSYGPR